MRFQWLGTAAGEGWPALFCDCEYCKLALERGGREIRTRSASLIDGELLIDMSPDLLHQRITQKLELGKVSNMIITHNHADHYLPDTIELIPPPYAYPPEGFKPNIYSGSDVIERAKRFGYAANLVTVKAGDKFQAGNYTVTALPAVHMEGALMYLIQREGKAVLYAHDTGKINDEAFSLIARDLKSPLALVSMDCTNGPLTSDGYAGHMGFKQNILVRGMLIERGFANEHTRFVANHFSHNGGMLYRESVEEMAPHGIEISYDGMIANI